MHSSYAVLNVAGHSASMQASKQAVVVHERNDLEVISVVWHLSGLLSAIGFLLPYLFLSFLVFLSVIFSFFLQSPLRMYAWSNWLYFAKATLTLPIDKEEDLWFSFLATSAERYEHGSLFAQTWDYQHIKLVRQLLVNLPVIGCSSVVLTSHEGVDSCTFTSGLR